MFGGALNMLHSYPIMVSGVWINVTTANTLWYLLVKADATGGNMSLQMSGCRGFIRLENAYV